MATIVIHGTMTWRGAQNYPWWFNSWGDRGFLRGRDPFSGGQSVPVIPDWDTGSG